MGKKVKLIVDVTELGRKGGQARAANLTDAERSEASRKAVQARWDAYYQAHPEKKRAVKKAAKKGPK